jgi:RimJ/RimL family protein N-acetyltransferase
MKIPRRLETERLIIRPCKPDDLPQMQCFFSSEESTRYLVMRPEEKTPEAIKRLLETIIASYCTSEPIFALAITPKDKDEYIGSCGLFRTPQEDMLIYYALLPEYRGNGYAVEAMKKLFEYAFSELGLDRLVADMHSDNLKSQRVAHSLKMNYEGGVTRDANHEGLRYSIGKEKYYQL